MKTSHLGLLRILTLLWAPVLWAGDGVIEINQAGAMAGGIDVDDTPGFPVTLCSGSYRLTSDLILSNSDGADTDAILIKCQRVSLDMNGFAIQGFAVCQGNPTPGCSASGEGRGIGNSKSAGEFVTIRNGKIHGMFSHAIELGKQADISDMQIFYNGGNGIDVKAGSRIHDVTVSDNVGTGVHAADLVDNITLGLHMILENSFFERNGDGAVFSSGNLTNIFTVDNGGVSDWQVSAKHLRDSEIKGSVSNGFRGITSNNSTVTGPAAIDVISIAKNNYVSGTTTALTCGICVENHVFAGSGTGIKVNYAGEPTMVIDNSVSAAVNCLSLQSSTIYRGNNLTCKSVLTGIDKGGNTCDGSAC